MDKSHRFYDATTIASVLNWIQRPEGGNVVIQNVSD